MDDIEYSLDDVVIFELPTFPDVEAFRDRIRPRWDGWSESDEEGWLFAARGETPAELAALLREAQALVAELGLPLIRFYLDGRVYVLEAADPSRTADLAARSK